ncbi:N-acetyl-gamma-glutamyl-phosphate reductase [Alkalicoccus daliensis]|uniref:N-acetyl-gamma-glutamyl-phosphate reductase n=1 Tax=Alkalicoccus daliensis TaxID=745820 RepID=A0A1H0AK66_9BACI|nr:N-acetyl-gamma-glutamyl-phosphate reductase [Alkalicoccus daliensis]SDN33940.1 N-acetyl-gamma-glutamyl-phosphate reductase [Alkalicoccus daliensis]
MKRAAIIGGTGYGGLELIRLLDNHPNIQTEKVISRSDEGLEISARYPHLTTIINTNFYGLNKEALNNIDVVFFATPAGVAKNIIPDIQTPGVQYIDLSGDLRIDNQAEYETWYQLSPPDQSLQKSAVFGLPELYKEEIRQAEIISNPGCFATAAILGLAPLISREIIDPETIIIDGKTGVSGAGRKVSLMTHFSETNENIKAYKAGAHQHTPEIEQHLTKLAGNKIFITLQTHLIPMTRGIMCTIYAKVKKEEDVFKLFNEFFKHQPFVRIRPEGNMPQTKEVYGSNFCDIGLHFDKRTKQVVIVSVIDNLVKGASGQALQNVNLMNGWDETAGLTGIPLFP